MLKSESIANLAKALSTVQGKLTYAKKIVKIFSTNPITLTLNLFGMLVGIYCLLMVWQFPNFLALIRI